MFKKTLLALATTAALASAAPAWAASFYLTIPMAARGTAPIGNVSVNLANGTLANAMVGEPYSATVKNHLSVTGDEGFNFNRVGWNVSTGALPAGLDFNVTTGAITGTPTAPGANTFGITATYRGKADEGMFNLSVMEILLALQNKTLPAGQIGAEYSAGLQNFLTVTGDQAFNGSNVGWSFTSGSLPAGLLLNAATGEITGTPTAPASAPFVVSATYRGKTASGTYSVSVLDITVNLSAATLADAVVNQPYSVDLAANLAVANDASFTPGTTPVNWTLSSGTLPPGLELSAAGLVAGTPTARTGKTGVPIQVKASYKGKEGQQTYTIKVGGTALQVSKIAAGLGHTCAITTAGALKCWGLGGHGQLGNGSTANQASPTTVTGFDSGVTHVAARANNTCAIKGGALSCWGAGNNYQLGNGSPSNRDSPTPVTSMGENVTAVSIGTLYDTTCAIKSGAAYCWGYNGHGQAGPVSATPNTPNILTALSENVTAIAVGYLHGCAVQAGALKCWGYNNMGQLGTYPVSHNLPIQAVPGMGSGIISVEAGYHTCANNTAGVLKCWGSNSVGQLGLTYNPGHVPTAVPNLGSAVSSFSVSQDGTCVATDAGAAKCWGLGTSGQIGNGSSVNKSTATDVTDLGSGVRGISTGETHTCAVLVDGSAKCWGTNSYRELGDGTTTNSSKPVSVIGL